jgi:hypothetical protein
VDPRGLQSPRTPHQDNFCGAVPGQPVGPQVSGRSRVHDDVSACIVSAIWSTVSATIGSFIPERRPVRFSENPWRDVLAGDVRGPIETPSGILIPVRIGAWPQWIIR